ncbi:MAG: response regulator [Deltaproteobacteria bacterium]|nr:MAG: response regulator [Deltaproteobacteria bacterium]
MGKKKILLVEDEFFLAENIRNRLEFSGYDLSYAENGEEALKMLERQPCDLVILDVMMPIMDGIETAKNIRANKNSKICLFFFNSQSSPSG